MTEIQISIDIPGQGIFAGTLRQAEAPPVPRVLLTTVAVDSLSGSPQSNIVVEFGLPFRGAKRDQNGEIVTAAWLESGRRLAVYDGDTRLAVQEDSRASDRPGDLRFNSVACLLPSLAARETRVLTVYTEPGSPVPGATKTIADLLALNTDHQCTVKCDIYGTGTIYRADFRAAAAGSTKWTRGSLHRRDAWFHDGALRKTFTCLMPLMNSGSPHSHAYVEFLATAFSTDNFASDMSWRFDPLVSDGWFKQANPDNWPMDIEITTGIASPVTVKSFDTRANAGTVTRVGTALTSTTGEFTANDQGRVIYNPATGKRALITKYNSATSVNIAGAGQAANNNLEAQAFPPGALKIFGLHLGNNGSYWEPEAWQGNQASYRVRHDRNYLFNSRMLLNWACPSSYLNNTSGAVGTKGGGTTAGTQWLDQLGDNPLRLKNNYIGECYSQVNEPDAQVLPPYQYLSLRKTDNNSENSFITADGLRRVMETAYLWANHHPWCILDDDTGLLINPDSRGSAVDNNLPTPLHGRLVDYEQGETAHSWSHWYIPYLLTGRLRWLRAHHEACARAWLVTAPNPPPADSLGLNRIYWIRNQRRAIAWIERLIAEAAVITPDDQTRALTGWDKDDFLDYHATNAKLGYAYLVDNGSGRSGWSQAASPLGPGPDTRDPTAPFWMLDTVSNGHASAAADGFQFSYFGQEYGHQREIGMTVPDGDALYARIYAHLVEARVNAAIVDPAQVLGIYHLSKDYPVSAYSVSGWPLTWADLYPAMAAENAPAGASVNGYRAYIWMALVLCDQYGFYDAAKTKAALEVTVGVVAKSFGYSVHEGGSEADFLVPPSPTSIDRVTLVTHWVARRTD